MMHRVCVGVCVCVMQGPQGDSQRDAGSVRWAVGVVGGGGRGEGSPRGDAQGVLGTWGPWDDAWGHTWVHGMMRGGVHGMMPGALWGPQDDARGAGATRGP